LDLLALLKNLHSVGLSAVEEGDLRLLAPPNSMPTKTSPSCEGLEKLNSSCVLYQIFQALRWAGKAKEKEVILFSL